MSTAPTPADATPPDDPWLTVHALTEFIYCPRAGLLVVETNAPDDHERPPANLDFSLPYTLEELDGGVNRALNGLWLRGAAVGLVLFLAAAASRQGSVVGLLVTGVVLLVLARPVNRQVGHVMAIVNLRRAVLSRERREMSLQEPTSQPVDWWDALRSGWVSVRCHEAYRDEDLRLSGGPWRVLRQGSLSIPVFRLPHSAGDTPPKVYPQHIARIAGYCHLITTCEGRESPCGVLLFGDTYRGVTVPNTAQAQELLRRELVTARRVMREAFVDDKDPPAAPPTLCSGCPHGCPREYSEGATDNERHGELIPVFGKVGPDRRLYHSPCGDRFVWVPPHAAAQRRGMT